MHSACLFPGLNAIARERDRTRFLALPTVQKYITKLKPLGYSRWLERPANELYASNDFTALASLTLAIQTGVFEHVCNRGFKPDVLIGCSLGDLSRTVCSGAIQFDDAIKLISNFEMIVGSINAGTTFSVGLPAGQNINDEIIDELQENKLEPSVLSNRHFIIGCDAVDAKLLIELSRSRDWLLKESPFNFALHSRHLIPLVNQLRKKFKLKLSDPTIPIFSTYKLKVIDTAEDLDQEAWHCFCTPMQWVVSLQKLSVTHDIKQFINIGPCMSLPLLLRESNLDITMENVRLNKNDLCL